MSLELQDLEVMEQIIRICQGRGVFKPEEMIHVGILYKKLLELLEKNKKKSDTNSMPYGQPQMGPSQMGTSQMGPSQMVQGQMVQGQMGPSQIGPSQMGPSQKWGMELASAFSDMLPTGPMGPMTSMAPMAGVGRNN